jgi:hypothetical protein
MNHNKRKKVKSKKRKETIPKGVKVSVWSKYIGRDKVKGMCYCCQDKIIHQDDFQCGHVQSEHNGGKVTIQNLRPICGICNSSMGTKHMIDYMKLYGYDTSKFDNIYRDIDDAIDVNSESNSSDNDNNDVIVEDYFEIQTQTSTHGLRSFYDTDLKKNRINLQPEYQRDFAWNAEKQNLLIDSIMRSFVIQSFIFAKSDKKEYKYECIDGQHRLSVIKHFISGEKLNGHQIRWQRKNAKGITENIFYEKNVFTDKNGTPHKKYMTDSEKERFDDYLISICIITNEDLKFTDRCLIFNRLQNGERTTRLDRIKNIDHPISEPLRQLNIHRYDEFKKTEFGKQMLKLFGNLTKRKSKKSMMMAITFIVMRYIQVYVKGIDEITSWLDMNLERDIYSNSDRINIGTNISAQIITNIKKFVNDIYITDSNIKPNIYMFFIIGDIYNHVYKENMEKHIIQKILNSYYYNKYNDKKNICDAGKIPSPSTMKHIKNEIVNYIESYDEEPEIRVVSKKCKKTVVRRVL